MVSNKAVERSTLFMYLHYALLQCPVAFYMQYPPPSFLIVDYVTTR